MLPRMESVEPRMLYSISAKSGIMHINLTPKNDIMTFLFVPQLNEAVYTDQSGTKILEEKTVSLKGIKRINVECGKGEDIVSLSIGTTTIRCFVNGASGNDDISADTKGNSVLTGGAGNDTLIGGIGNDELDGDTGNDSMVGGKGNDTLTGGAGMDDMEAGKGDDLIYAQDGGPDTMSGGGGTDTAYVDAGSTGDFGIQNLAQFKASTFIETVIT